jgi:hypothetical protein
VVPLRYSPKPIDDYNATIKGPDGPLLCGPGTSEMLRGDVEAWNLAYLSHDYDRRAEHPDPDFTVIVRRTTNLVLSSGTVDVAGKMPAAHKLRHLLKLPAPIFVSRMQALNCVSNGKTVRLLDRMPIYQKYGDAWLHFVTERAWHCLRAPVATEFQPGDEVNDVSQAAGILKDILK